MNLVTLAADPASTEPSAAKFFAMLLAIGGFLLVAKVYSRYKDVNNGAKVDPFSPEADRGTLPENPQVTPSADTPEEAPERTSKRGFRLPWKGGK